MHIAGSKISTGYASTKTNTVGRPSFADDAFPATVQSGHYKITIMIYCGGVDAPPCHAVFPEVDKDGIPPTIKFKNIQHTMKTPYIIYADTESIIKPVDSPNTDSNTVQSTEHVPCSFAYVVVRSWAGSQ